MAGISEGEVAIYDRQLRLWGVQAQQRLLKAKVLVWGLDGSNVEAVKNLVLAGVSLSLCDGRTADLESVAFNYFLRKEDLGKPLAECAAKRVQEMNPLNEVKTLSIAEGDVAKGALDGFDFVLLSARAASWKMDFARDVDLRCREKGTAFALTLSCGELACFVSDLGKAHVVQEKSGAQGGAGAPAAAAAEGAETVSFPSFQEWLDCPLEALKKGKADSSFQLLALFAKFCRDKGAAAGKEAEFREYCGADLKVDGIEDVGAAYKMFFLEPLVHVASVLGGLLAQEVIKAITKRDLPLCNSVCFNATTSAALVERIPQEAAQPKKRKAEEEVADLLDDD